MKTHTFRDSIMGIEPAIEVTHTHTHIHAFRDSIMGIEPSIEVLPAGWTEHISKTTGFFIKFL